MFEHKKRIDIVKYRWIWLGLSLILLLPGIFAMIYSSVKYENHLPLRVGIDFTGGTIVQYGVNDDVTPDELSKIRSELTKKGIETSVIQVINNSSADEKHNIKNIISLRTAFIKDADVTTIDSIGQVMNDNFKSANLIQTNSIGPSLGKELLKNSLAAILLASLGIVFYLSLRFKLDFAVIAMLSLIHDTIFVLGAFSILGLIWGVQIDALFITAILTVIGFSNHDTIVVFDRIRENVRFLGKKKTFNEIVNISVNQTLERSINTSVTTLLTLGALYFFGGVTTKDFVLAMIIGIIIGTYSSIFFASTVVAMWRDYKAKKKPASV